MSEENELAADVSAFKRVFKVCWKTCPYWGTASGALVGFYFGMLVPLVGSIARAAVADQFSTQQEQINKIASAIANIGELTTDAAGSDKYSIELQEYSVCIAQHRIDWATACIAPQPPPQH